MDKILKSLEYSALDHKWAARSYLKNKGWSSSQLFGESRREDKIPDDELLMITIALSSFKYYYLHYDNITQDPSLATVTTLCTASTQTMEIEAKDPQVTYLSNIFNKMVKSTRKLLQCYDCGTNARALFLKLVETGRGYLDLSSQEVQRMAFEYSLNKTDPLTPLKMCLDKLKKDTGEHIVTIMSVSFQDFGHVWVIEKRYFNGVPRFHHYQSALHSHMLIDFIEAMDYGADPMKSLNIDEFFLKLKHLLSFNKPWTDKEHRIFIELFAFAPSEVTNPEPGFCGTWVAI
jgi:hypothetical protein